MGRHRGIEGFRLAGERGVCEKERAFSSVAFIYLTVDVTSILYSGCHFVSTHDFLRTCWCAMIIRDATRHKRMYMYT